MRPSDFTSVDRSTFDFESVSGHQTNPMAVIRDATMTTEEKRSVLASWASDERTVLNNPRLRRLDNGSIVKIDDVLAALKRLDQLSYRSNPTGWDKQSKQRKRRPSFGRLRRRNRDNDDDDPPTPTPAAIPPRSPVLEGGTAVAA